MPDSPELPVTAISSTVGPVDSAHDEGHGSDDGQDRVQPGARLVTRYALPFVVLLVLAFVGYRLAIAPIHGVRDSAACDRAYAEARTHADSVSVRFLSYPDSMRPGQRSLCGYRRLDTLLSIGR